MPIIKRFAFIVLALFGFGALGVVTFGSNGSGFVITAAQADDDDDDGARTKRRGYSPNAQPRQGYQGQGAYRGRSYRNDDDDDDGAKNRRQSRSKQSRNDDDD